MKIIDFDAKFEKYAEAWIKENAAKYPNPDKLEAAMPSVYLRWINRPANWLEGLTPAEYFARFDEPKELIRLMTEYDKQRVPLPDLLVETVQRLDSADDALIDALTDGATPFQTKLTIVSMLREMESTKPMSVYIDWISRHGGNRDELADMAAESLAEMGAIVVEPVIEALGGANEAGREAFLDTLCNFRGDDRTLNLALDMFVRNDDRTALFASYLEKLGDDRALPHLLRAVSERKLSYLDFIELRNAIESLGGEVAEIPDFTGDPYYETLR